MTFHVASRKRGFTLTEMLVVMVIIGLLATIAIPVYISRMEDARVRLAKGEEREIAQAEEQCALIHGYYVPFQVLDDLPEPPPYTRTGDTLYDDSRSQIYLVNPLIRPELQKGRQFQLDSTTARIQRMVDSWEGPFLNPQRVYTGTQVDPRDPNWINRLDFPLDPWGTPYLFYSPLGIIGSSAYKSNGDFSNLTISFSDGAIPSSDTDARGFDRYAVVSYGRNLLGDNDTPNDKDDVIYLFGTGGVESDFGLSN